MSEPNAQDSEDDALSEVLITLSPIRLGALTGPRDSWRFEPLPAGALAVLRPLGSEVLLAAKTQGDRGLLYRLDAEHRASCTTDAVFYLRAPHRYHLWWTLDEQRYAEALDDPSVLDTEGTLIDVCQYVRDLRAPLQKELEDLERKDMKFEQRWEVRHAITHHLLRRHVFHETREDPIFDVTPPCIRALFTVEFMQWYLMKTHERSANHLATFEHVAAMIQAAEKGGRDRSLESRATELFPTPELRRMFDYFRDYAWRCAATGVQERDFLDSIAMNGPANLAPGGMPEDPGTDAGVPPIRPEGSWWTAATRIRDFSRDKKHGPAVHPHFQGITGPMRGLVLEGVMLDRNQRRLIASYYDSYRFGAQLRATSADERRQEHASDYRARMSERASDWTKQKEEVRAFANELLRRHAPPDVFLFTLSGCYVHDETLLERYLDAAAYSGFSWCEALGQKERSAALIPGPSGTVAGVPWPYWKTFKARVKPLAEVLKGTGKVSKLAGERLQAFTTSAEEAKAALDTLGRLEVTLAGADVDATTNTVCSEKVSVAIDDVAGEARVRLLGARTPGAPAHLSLRLIRKVPTVHPHGVADSPSGVTDASRQSFAPATLQGTFDGVEVPASNKYLATMSTYSKPFAVLGESVNVAIAAATLVSKTGTTDKLLAVFELTKGVVSVVESFPDAMLALTPSLDASPLLERAKSRAKSWKAGSQWLGRLDHVNKIAKGLGILFSEESDVANELRHGRVFRAEVQRFGDRANIVVGAASAVELTGVALEAAGIPSIIGLSTTLMAGFSATPWGLLLSVGGGVIAAGSALFLDMTLPWDERLLEVERALDLACKEEVRGPRFVVSERLDSLRLAVEQSWASA